MNRFVAVLLMFCLMISQVSLPTHAAEIVASGDCGVGTDELLWTLTSDGVLTVTGTGKMGDYASSASPSTQWQKEKIKKVVIEEGVSYVGDEAFKDCSNLESVIIADSVTEIGLRAFANCDSLTDVSLGCGLKETSGEVFWDCDALEEFTFPNTDTYYGNHFLAKCDGLKNVVFSEKMTRIGYSMFSGCTSLESIIIPDTVTFLGGGAFENTAIKEITLPDSITDIETHTFAFCKQLESVTLPKTLKSMGNSVFWDCKSLKTITVPASVVNMARTFEQAYGLESVKFLGNAPRAASSLFGNITVTVYYPANNPSWTETVRQDYGGTVAWIPYESDFVADEVIDSGNCSETVSWKLTNTWTLVISGEGEMPYMVPIPWYEWANRIEHIVIENGVTSIASNAFAECINAQSISIGETVTTIGSHAFSNCASALELTIPHNVKQIDFGAFHSMTKLERVRFMGDAPVIDESAFLYVVAGAIYPEGNPTWTEDKLLNYGGTLSWWQAGHEHNYTQITVDATCNEKGYHANYCESCEYLEIISYINCLGHDLAQAACGENAKCMREGCDYQDVVVASHEWDDPCSTIRHCVKCGIEDHNGGHLWDGLPGSIRGCDVCRKMEGGYRVYIDINVGNIFIDGQEYWVEHGLHGRFVDLPTNTATNMVNYSYSQTSAQNGGASYPSGMQVWILSCEGDYYTATYVPEFENLLQYAGSSIRISGTKGIRMITAIEKSKKEALTGKGLAGYKLVEYGTVLGWARFVASNSSLTLDKSFAKSNFAYKRGVADPIFAQTDTVIQYTNVLVGFTLDQCKDELAMRPYIVVEDANGRQITIYGGTVFRSIGYIAYQNRNVFQPGNASYDYVWEIIHHVYGTQYDRDYKG